jgi:tetratricopeptide (TPR) repeat protein
LLAGTVSFGYWWYKNKETAQELTDFKNDPLNELRSLDQILDKPYLPSNHVSAELNKCIQLYRDNLVEKARITCEEFLNSPAKDEEKSIALTVLGVIFDTAGRYPIAIERLDKATQYDPNNFHAYYNMSLVYRHMGRMEEARKAAKKARDIAPNDPVIARLSGNLFQELGDSDSALDAYKSGLRESPDDPNLLFNMAMTHYRKGKIADAIDYFEKAVDRDNSGRITVLSHSHLGKIYFNQENWKRAEFHYREVVRLQPENAESLFNLGLVQLKQDRKEEAVRFFKRALDGGSNEPETFLRLAEALESLRLPSLAIQSLKKALAIKPNDLDVLFALGDLHYKRGELIPAEDTFRKIINNTPGDAYTESALINLGIILDEMDRYSEAVDVLQRAIGINPKNYNAYYNLGIAYMHMGRPAQSIQAWERAASLETGNQFRASERIADYYSKSNYNDKATSIYDEILSTNPKAHSIRLKLAELYRKMGQDKSAERHLFIVLNQSTNGAEIKEAHKILALTYTNSKDPELSAKALEEAYRATQMDSGDMESRLVLAKILSNGNSLTDRQKAIDELKVIVASDSNAKVLSQAYNLMGVSQYKNRDFRSAIQSFDNALEIDPTYTEAYDNKRAARSAYEEGITSRGGLN